MATQTTASLFALTLCTPVLLASAAQQLALFSTWRARRAFVPALNERGAYIPDRAVRTAGREPHSQFAVWLHKLSIYQYAPVPYVNDMGFGELIQMILYIGLNVIFMTIPVPWVDVTLYDWKLLPEVASRGAWTGVGNAFFILMTATRNSVLEYITGVPFERMIMYHRWAGRMMFFQFAMHGTMYLEIYDRKNQFWNGVFYPAHPSNLWGLMALISLTILVAMSHSVVRRRSFDLFFYAHFMFIPFLVFGCMHSTPFTKWSIAGMVLYGVDRLVRIYKGYAECDTLAVQSFPGAHIVKLVLQPVRFEYEPGQYLFLKVPSLGREWYPFSISSAPDIVGKDKRITLHIKNNGDWTSKLVAQVEQRVAEMKRLNEEMVEVPKFKVWVDGGYGRAAERFEDHEVVIMVGGGIGGTPLLSVISSIIQRLELDLPTATTDLYFWWFVPSLAVCKSLAPELLEIQKRIHRVQKQLDVAIEVKVFVTRDHDQARKEMGSMSEAERAMVVLARGDVGKLMGDIKLRHPDRDVAVGVCGAKQMVRSVRNSCAERSDQDSLFRVHWETFNF